MNLKSKILLTISVLMLLGAGLILWLSSSKKQQVNEMLPEKVIVPTRGPEPTWFSDTGAAYISPTDEEYNKEQLFANLRNKCPFENDIFVVSYNYSTDKFVFVLKDKKNGQKLFDGWMKATGYDQIPSQFIEIE